MNINCVKFMLSVNTNPAAYFSDKSSFSGRRQYKGIHDINTWYQYMIPIHDINTWYQYMISIHDINTWYQYMISIHDINTWYQYMIPIHDINTWYQYMISTHQPYVRNVKTHNNSCKNNSMDTTASMMRKHSWLTFIASLLLYTCSYMYTNIR